MTFAQSTFFAAAAVTSVVSGVLSAAPGAATVGAPVRLSSGPFVAAEAGAPAAVNAPAASAPAATSAAADLTRFIRPHFSCLSDMTCIGDH
ncbi:hypothetical protein GCM10009678_92300 [Actinomadura kijaniata]